MLLKDFPAERLYLTLEDDLEARTLQAEVEPPDTTEE